MPPAVGGFLDMNLSIYSRQVFAVAGESGDIRALWPASNYPTVPARNRGKWEFSRTCQRLRKGRPRWLPIPTDALSHLADVTDRMHGLLMERADTLMGCVPRKAELATLTDVIEAYERQRWPEGKIPGGKG